MVPFHVILLFFRGVVGFFPRQTGKKDPKLANYRPWHDAMYNDIMHHNEKQNGLLIYIKRSRK